MSGRVPAVALALTVSACGLRSEVKPREADAGLAQVTATSASASPPHADEITGTAPAGTVVGRVVDPANQPLKDAIVWVLDLPPERSDPKTHALIDQVSKSFVPHVLPVLVGSTVDFKNSDAVMHNAYSRANPAKFDLGRYPAPESRSFQFGQAGRVDVFCAVHSHMHTIVMVLETSRFAVTDERGQFRIDRVPEGSHAIRAWHEFAEQTDAHVAVGGQKGATVTIAMGAQ
jgi:plastocyanin